MRSENYTWLWIEPYVHFTEQNGHVLFYNTLNHKTLEYKQTVEITILARQLLDDVNGYVIQLSAADSSNPVIKRFVRHLQRLQMGGILPSHLSGIKPVNIIPYPAFRQKLKPYEEGIERQGVRTENFLHMINLHVNTGHSHFTDEFPGAFLQFPAPYGSEQYGKEMDFQMIDQLKDDLKHASPLTLNIFGSEPEGYSHWNELTQTFAKTGFNIKYHFTLPQAELADIEHTGKNTVLSLFVTFPFYTEDLATIQKLENSFQKKSQLEYNFIIRDLADLEKAQQLIAHFNIQNWFFKPYFTGGNMSFFEENVFITPEDVAGSKPDQKQIFSRITFNENDFGKFTIMPDGTVFSNVNDPALGNFRHMGVISMIEAEMDKGISWRRTRTRVMPCSTCSYHFLCPPISNYEILMGKYNFCHIYKEGN